MNWSRTCFFFLRTSPELACDCISELETCEIQRYKHMTSSVMLSTDPFLTYTCTNCIK
uniref:Uncharacterized protein n=1 Tax=Oryza brachyantha TaxID=4533 RepID=J3LRN2_ORYBR